MESWKTCHGNPLPSKLDATLTIGRLNPALKKCKNLFSENIPMDTGTH
jgi:hypothetical protein